MAETQWYELRVLGSAGTSAASDIHEGIALSETGRLCPVSSGLAKKFDSDQEAIDFLSKTTVPGLYPFEPVLCHAAPQGNTGRGQSRLDLAA